MDIMSPLADLFDKLRHRSTEKLQVIALADPEAEGAPADGDLEAGEYFEIRLVEMYLKDERLWHREVAPAAFLVTEFGYDGATARRPFFLSNTLPPETPAPLDPGPLRVRFSNLLAAGPAPYAGGDVAVFVGLFQTTLKDWRAIAFDMFEKLFGNVDLGAMSHYLKLADKVSGTVLRCLGEKDVECILADKRTLGEHAPPRPGYLAYLGRGGGTVAPDSLVVRDGELMRVADGEERAYDETDYCLLRIRRAKTRNDHALMPFYALWVDARAKTNERKPEEAQVLMLKCADQIYASPDLTEGDKERLIKYYVAKLDTAAKLREMIGGTAQPTRAGSSQVIGAMQQRAAASGGFAAEQVQQVYAQLSTLADELEQPAATGEVDEERSLQAYMDRAAAEPGKLLGKERLMGALALGSIDGAVSAVRRGEP
jgi:hypothetical protein